MGLKATRQGRYDSIPGACVPHACPGSPQWLIGYVFPLRGKATADGEPASVTDKEPALNSAGRCDPVD